MINPDLHSPLQLVKEWQPRIPHGMETVMADIRKTLEDIRPIKDSLLAFVPLREALRNAVDAIQHNAKFNFLRIGYGRIARPGNWKPAYQVICDFK